MRKQYINKANQSFSTKIHSAVTGYYLDKVIIFCIFYITLNTLNILILTISIIDYNKYKVHIMKNVKREKTV